MPSLYDICKSHQQPPWQDNVKGAAVGATEAWGPWQNPKALELDLTLTQ